MFPTRAQKRIYKKATLELNSRRDAQQPSLPDQHERRPPSNPVTFGSAGQGLSHPPRPSSASQRSPLSDTTFCSVVEWTRQGSTRTCDTADDLQSAPTQNICDLTNPVHPIFRKSNCHGDARKYYDHLLPAFKLASRYLQTPCLLPFWYTSFFSEVQDIQNPWYSAGKLKSYEYLNVPRTLTSEQLKETEDVLNWFADYVRFTVRPTAERQGNTPESSFFHHRRYNGHGRIFICRPLLRGLREAIKIGDWAAHAWSICKLAATLGHELAHAVPHMTRGPHHYYFPGEMASEAGYDFEKRVLGSIIERHPHDPALAVLLPWPNTIKLGEYLHHGLMVGVRTKPLEACGPNVGILSIWHIARHMREEFWSGEVARFGPDAVRHQPQLSTTCFLGKDEAIALSGLKGVRRNPERRLGGIFDGVDLGLPPEAMSIVRPLQLMKQWAERAKGRLSI